MNKTLDIIWNITKICPWDCNICCVDAVNVRSKSGKIKIISESLNKEETIDSDKSLDIYDQALKIRQEKRLELSLEEKLQVLDNLEGTNFEIDFSGGDPLVCSENLEVIRYAANKYGRENFTVTTTGVGLSKIKAEQLIPYISKLEFTYDNAEEKFDPIRPREYNNSNLKKASLLSRKGINIKALMPLSKRNISPRILRLLYENLHVAGIREVELMRYFPVGRGLGKNEEMPSREEYEMAIEIFYEMEAKYNLPKVNLQCALKCLYNTSNENPCNLYRESLGITAKGILLTSAWAIGSKGEPLDEIFVLGSLVDNSISELLNSEKGHYYQRRLDENLGHCKIFAYLNSKKEDPFDRLFDRTDPFYGRD